MATINTPTQTQKVKKITFESTGQEKTAFRFSTDLEANITDVNELPANLINALE